MDDNLKKVAPTKIQQNDNIFYNNKMLSKPETLPSQYRLFLFRLGDTIFPPPLMPVNSLWLKSCFSIIVLFLFGIIGQNRRELFQTTRMPVLVCNRQTIVHLVFWWHQQK